MSTLNVVIQGKAHYLFGQLFISSYSLKTPLFQIQTLPRNHHVYQLIVQPTWKTAVVRKRLKGGLGDFQIDLMDGVF